MRIVEPGLLFSDEYIAAMRGTGWRCCLFGAPGGIIIDYIPMQRVPNAFQRFASRALIGHRWSKETYGAVREGKQIVWVRLKDWPPTPKKPPPPPKEVLHDSV